MIDSERRRDPFIDWLRVTAMGFVVAGHWATTTIVWDPERVSSINALSVIPSVRISTWIVQVMPLVFFAGGFSNAMSLGRAGTSLSYVRMRMRRLLTPTAAFLAIWLVIGLVIEMTDPTGSGKARAAEAAALPLWFLGIYVIAVAAAPAMWRLHRRYRWWVPGLLGAGVVLVDLFAIGFDVEDLGGLNYAFVWLLAHQVGFFYADGTLRRLGLRGALGLAGGGLAALVALVTVFGYPVSLVGVPGGRSNAEPPTLAIIAATAWLVGLVLALRPAVLRWLERERTRRTVSRLHGLLLSTYVWHITALMFGAGLWRAAGWPEPAIGSGGWWLQRIPWLVLASIPLVALLWIVRRFEIHPEPTHRIGDTSVLASVSIGLGVFAIAVGLLGFGETGFLPLAPTEGEAILMFDFNPVQNVVHLLIGFAVLAAAGSPRWTWWVTPVGAVTFAVIGLGHWAGWLDRLGMNGTSAATHVIVGSVALIGAAGVGLRARRGRGSAA